MPNILVIGDSITYGAIDIDGGWVQKLRRYLDKKNRPASKDWFFVYNLGISGDTTDMIRRRFESEVNSRVQGESDEEIILIFQVGGNDCAFIRSSKTQIISKESFRENTEAIIEKSRMFSNRIIFLGLLPINDKLTTPIPWDTPWGKIDYMSKYAQDYNSILRLICETQKVSYIDLFEEFKKVDYKKLLADGLHPNAKGHEMIYDIVKTYLVKNKIIK